MDENLPNSIDRLFSDGVPKFASVPSDEVWNRIEQSLDEENQKAILHFKLGWKRAAVALLILLAGLGVLTKIYFYQERIFAHQLSVHGKLTKHIIKSSGAGQISDRLKTDKINFPGNQTPKISAAGLTSNRDDPAQNIRGLLQPAYVDAGLNADSHTGLPAAHVQEVHYNLPEMHIFFPAISKATAGEKTVDISTVRRLHLFKSVQRLSVTPYFTKEFAGYSLTDNDATGEHGREIEARERNVFSASVGLFINYKLSNRLVLQSGVSYAWSNSNIDSAISYAVKNDKGGVQFKLNTISGYSYLPSTLQPNVGDSVFTAKSYSQLHYLSVPLIISYQMPFHRFFLLVGAGASFNLLTSSGIETKTYGNGFPEKEYAVRMMGLKKTILGAVVKLELEYRLNSKLGVNIISSFKNTLSPINLKSAITAYPYNVGVGAGFTFHL